MIETMAMNASTNANRALSSLSSYSPVLIWVMTFSVMLGVFITAFVAYKQWEKFCTGAGVTTALGLVGWMSHWSVKQGVNENNPYPLYLIGGIVGFILISILLGNLVEWLEKKYTKRGKKNVK
jgi:hypothetical protein